VVNAKFEKIINNIIDQLPHILVAAIFALLVLIWGLWVNTRDNAADIDTLKRNQLSSNLCDRLKLCPKCEELDKSLRILENTINKSEQHILLHNSESESWKQRIIRLENQIYELQTLPKARPDAFTGAMGKALESRIEQLEEMEYPEHGKHSNK
jgi:hypothetical protein